MDATTLPPKRQVRRSKNLKPRLVRVLDILDIIPAPENEKVYRPIHDDDPEVIALAKSIKQYGVREPLVVTMDGYILSGHRRHAAALLAGLTEIPCLVENVSWEHDYDECLHLLCEYNRQRVKTFDEQFREEVVLTNPDDAYASLIKHRQQSAKVTSDGFEIIGSKHRCKISPAKKPLLDAVLRILEERKAFWPLSDRSIHYPLLNDPPLRHASKPSSFYINHKLSYSDLTDLLTRARISGLIPWEAIEDETRPVVSWDTFSSPQPFIQKELNSFLKGYWRNLMQSQPNHIEIIGEKNTIHSIVRSVSMR